LLTPALIQAACAGEAEGVQDSSCTISTRAACAGEAAVLPSGKHPSPKARLGEKLFFDANLSEPAGQSCSSCHDPSFAFTDPDQDVPTSEGASPALKGNRNAPTALYAAFSPPFHFDETEGLYLGGQFYDGRARTLVEQAKGPFLNPLEMANKDKASVVDKVQRSDYADLFAQVYGPNAFEDTERAYERIAQAIAAFERSPAFARFSSRYDYYLYGQAEFTEQEKRGKKLFEDEDKGNCAACHPNRPSPDGTPPLFTDFSYDNLGVPRNPNNPFYALPPDLNPKGYAFVDRGLGAIVGKVSEIGKIKVPTLRNIARTKPYMHNGFFETLRGLVDFYNTRDIKPPCPNDFASEKEALAQGCWPVPEVSRNVNHAELGTLGLTEQEVDDIVAFLLTLDDGYRPQRPGLKK
jgi:cytochrome c peroxidase